MSTNEHPSGPLRPITDVDDLFVFAIPLLPRSRAANWQRVLDNLQATLQSILNQRDQKFHCLLAAEDPIPLPEISSSKVTLINVTESQRLYFARDDYKLANQDAGRKKALMRSHATSLRAKYIMFTDADDLLSNNIVEHIRIQKPKYGAALRSGYVMDGQSGKCLSVPSKFVTVEGFDTYCGTSIVFNLSENQSGHENPLSQLWHMGHNLVREAAIKNNTPLLDVFAPLAIYILNNGENLSAIESNDNRFRSFASQVVDNINRHGSPLTKAQLEEFGLWSA